MVNQVKIGPPGSAYGDGGIQEARGGQGGDQLVSAYNAAFYEQTVRRKMFSAANPTGITSTALVSGTTTVFLGFGLSNPITSPVNLVIQKVGYSCWVPPATAANIVIATGFSAATNVTHTTPLTVRNNLIGDGLAGYGLADSSFTVPTAPAVNTILGTLGTGAVTVSMVTPSVFDIEGSIILKPGAYMLVAALVAAGASGAFASACWYEEPVLK